MRIIIAILSAFALALVSVTAEAFWSPFATYVVEGLNITLFGEDWTGIEKEPEKPTANAVQPGCLARPEPVNVSTLPHHEVTDAWRMIVSSKGKITARIDEQGSKYEVVGIRQDRWIVLSYRGSKGGHGTLFLEMNDEKYYTGYQISDDCHSPIKGAALKCPYVLFQYGQEQAAKKNPMLAQKCENVQVL